MDCRESILHATIASPNLLLGVNVTFNVFNKGLNCFFVIYGKTAISDGKGGKYKGAWTFPCSFHIWRYWRSAKCEMNTEIYTA